MRADRGGIVVEKDWEFGVLGPVEVRRGGVTVRIKSQKQRALLAMLLLGANRVVSVDSMIDGLWGAEPPSTVAATLQVHVANLRKALGSDDHGRTPIDTRPPGYSISVDSDALDCLRFEELVRRGRKELEHAKPAQASVLLARALDCWRGPALADVVSEPFARSAAVRLDEQRLAVLADRIEADLVRGAHAELVGELRELTVTNPLRERFWEQLMVALYRCGNQAEALAAFRSARASLLDELGLEPGPTLRRLETAVLDQSASLDWAPNESGAIGVGSTVFEADTLAALAYLDQGGTLVPLRARTTIGRHPACALVLEDTKVSREHAVIRPTVDGFALVDLHSTNGTFVNGARVEEVVLADGDRIGIGSQELVFRFDEP